MATTTNLILELLFLRRTASALVQEQACRLQGFSYSLAVAALKLSPICAHAGGLARRPPRRPHCWPCVHPVSCGCRPPASRRQGELAVGLACCSFPDRARRGPRASPVAGPSSPPALLAGVRCWPPTSRIARRTADLAAPPKARPVVALSPVRLAALASPHFRCGARSVSGRVLAALASSSDNSFSHLGSLSYVALL